MARPAGTQSPSPRPQIGMILILIRASFLVTGRTVTNDYTLWWHNNSFSCRIGVRLIG